MKNIFNIIWLMTDKLFKLVFGLFVTLIMANELGSELFGYYNYIISLCFLMIPFATLGLDNNLTKEFINLEASKVFSNSVTIKFIASIVAILIPLIIYLVLENDLYLLLSIANISYLMKSVDVVRFYWEAKLENKKNAIIESVVFFISSLLKLYVVYLHPSVSILIFIVAVEGFVYAIMVLYSCYKFKITLFRLSFINLNYAIDLIRKSLPLMVSTVSVVIYMKVDQLMLAQMSTYQQVGILAMAAKFSQSWYFFPVSIITVISSNITIKYKIGDDLSKDLINSYSLLHIISIFSIVLISFIITNFSYLFINEDYNGFEKVLIVHIMGGFFVAINTLRSRMLIIKEMQKYILYLTVLGAIINIVMNLIFIPQYGAVGAAYATLFSQICVCFIIPFFFKEIKSENAYIYLSFVNHRFFSEVKSYVRNIKSSI
ncbi:flippase [Vibrio cholerae]|nr:flippase [Vibrio cholerae]